MIFPEKRPKIPTSSQCCNPETLLDPDTKKSIYDPDFPKSLNLAIYYNSSYI